MPPRGNLVGMKIMVPRELAVKMARIPERERFLKKSFDGSVNPVVNHDQAKCTMPSQHSPDKEPLSLQIPRTLMGRLRKAAKKSGVKVPAYVAAVLAQQTLDVVLTSHDYEAIAKATKEAEQTGRRCATRFDDPA